MRTVYRNPKELATCLKDIIDVYLESLISEEKLKEKLNLIVKANYDRIYKDGNISSKIKPYLGDERIEIINRVIVENND